MKQETTISYKDFAIVILNWNGEKLLGQFLPSIVEHSQDAAIYVIDNASTDNSITILKSQFPTVHIIQNKDNYGYAGGYNKGLQTIEEPYLVLVNSDIEVTANWLAPVHNIFETQPKTAIVQPKILDFKNKTHFEYAGAAGGFIDKYGFPFCRGRIFDTVEEDYGQYDDETTIFWASGACFFIRNEVFRQLNGFDNNFFAHQEEIDLCWRAQNEGYVIKYTGQSTVYHVGGATLGYYSAQKTYLNFRNSLMMMNKNLPTKGKSSTIFIRLCLDGIAGVRYFLTLKPKHCFAIVHAHFGFYKRLKKCQSVPSKTKINNYFHIKSIVFLYFRHRKKVYSEI
ncbi:MAG: glycosyltransferase family 2 protein [Flavobacteriaceae bacterium]|jgi:GT2 family glycosyltransferase|nr:glycosyltransferase family 2 protein [Flavobacteriaceae bacterium]